MLLKYVIIIQILRNNKRGSQVEKDNKKEYQKPELSQYENLNEVTKGGVNPPDSGIVD